MQFVTVRCRFFILVLSRRVESSCSILRISLQVSQRMLVTQLEYRITVLRADTFFASNAGAGNTVSGVIFCSVLFQLIGLKIVSRPNVRPLYRYEVRPLRLVCWHLFSLLTSPKLQTPEHFVRRSRGNFKLAHRRRACGWL